MLQTPEKPNLQLPKGCIETPPTRLGRLLGKGESKVFGSFEKRWNNYWPQKERKAYAVFETVASSIALGTDPEIENLLQQVNEKGISYKVIFSQGIQAIREGRLLLTTSNRTGGSIGDSYARGGYLKFETWMGRPLTGMRGVEGESIGVVLNTENRNKEIKPLHDGSFDVPSEYIEDILQAVVQGYLELETTPQVDTQNFLTPAEFNRALKWVITGK